MIAVPAGAVDNVLEAMVGTALMAGLLWVCRQTSWEVRSFISSTPREKWFAALSLVLSVALIGTLAGGGIVLWYVGGIYTASSAVATGSPVLPMVWFVVVLLFLGLAYSVPGLNRSRPVFLLAAPLMSLNFAIPIFKSISYSSASPFLRDVFDFFVAGGAIGEGLFITTLVIFTFKVIVMKSRATNGVDGTVQHEEVPYNYPFSIWLRILRAAHLGHG